MEAPGRLLAGEIGKPFGLGGELYVVRISDDPHRFDPGAQLLDERGRTLVIETSRAHGNRWLLKFTGVDDRDAAEKLRGPVYVATTDVRKLDEDEYWPHELIDCAVVLTTGAQVGVVDRVVPGGAHDLLAVATPSGERLVPVVKDIVVDVDVANRRIVIDPPAGLVD